MSDCCHKEKPFDFILWGSVSIILLGIVASFFMPHIDAVYDFAYAMTGFLKKMWWGVVLGTLSVGLMSKVPREYFLAVLGRGDTLGGVLRATIAGLFLDLCSHGIVIIGAKLYERGASLAQVMAFLIASPWNSFSLTIILVSLIGLKYTLAFVAGSVLIAVVSGMVYILLTHKGILPQNPHKVDLPQGFSLKDDARVRLAKFKFTPQFVKEVVHGGLKEVRMLLRWLLLGVVIASAVQAFVPPHIFTAWFGPTLLGLAMTLVVTTVIEVCSEGSAPIAAQIMNGAGAPGNGFAFLMAGVSTDYTEMLVIREFSKSWKVALSLPLITVPQVFLLGWLLNTFQ